MLDCVAECITEDMVEEIKGDDCFAMQVDGSVDKYSIDNVFITARYTARYINKVKEMKVAFLGESYSHKRDAEDLSDAIVMNLEKIGLKKS
jgi:hypothetical protein